jgi:Zn-dependent metalloprotease
MNEAFSDIWGACIEYYSTWKIYLVNWRDIEEEPEA